MSVIDTLITDRTATDVQYIKALNAKGWADMTAFEREYWLGELAPLYASDGLLEASDGQLYTSDGDGTVRGAYNAADLNRVGAACAYLYALFISLGYSVPSYAALKTDWTVTDIPTAAQMTTYLNTVAALKAVWTAETALPATMSKIDYADANNIEALLVEVDGQITRLASTLDLGWALGIAYIGLYGGAGL